MRERLLRRAELSAGERAAMFELLTSHFAGVTPERFEADLAEKDWVLLLEEAPAATAGGPQRLRGFSTLHLYETSLPDDGPCAVVYSGDTIVDPAAWGSASLSRSWIAAVRRLHEGFAGRRLWWLLLTSGFRTYRFLPVFWREFWPRHDAVTPAAPQRRLALLARQRFGALYDEVAGVVRFPEPQRLRDELAVVPSGRHADPHVAFFLNRNPGWRQGDELVCLTEIAESNLTAAGHRMWRGSGRSVAEP